MRILLFILLFATQANAQFRYKNGGNFNLAQVNGAARVGITTFADAETGTLPSPFDVGFASAVGGLTKSSAVGGRFGPGTAYRYFTDKAQSDVTFGLGCRSELNMLSPAAGATEQGYHDYEVWIGESLYIPSSWTAETSNVFWHILTQMHDNCFAYLATETDLKSAFEFVIWKNKWSFITRSNLTANGPITTEITPDMGNRMTLSNPDVVRDAWTDIVIHLKFKNGASPTAAQAVVQIWINGVLCADYSNLRMGYCHTQPPFVKTGNYSFMWNPENYADYTGFEVEPTKTHYMDLFRFGNSTSNYYSVFPGNY